MYEFFRVVERIGLSDRKMAKKMGYTPAGYSLVKNGTSDLTLRFVRSACRVLSEMGMRKESGEAYTVDDLFFTPVEVREEVA